jgi:hypothetical protein
MIQTSKKNGLIHDNLQNRKTESKRILLSNANHKHHSTTSQFSDLASGKEPWTKEGDNLFHQRMKKNQGRSTWKEPSYPFGIASWENTSYDFRPNRRQRKCKCWKL